MKQFKIIRIDFDFKLPSFTYRYFNKDKVKNASKPVMKQIIIDKGQSEKEKL